MEKTIQTLLQLAEQARRDLRSGKMDTGSPEV
jgi:hypothetical protein